MIREPFIGDLSLANHVRERNEALALAERANAAIAKKSEAILPADERRGIFVPGDDPVELRLVRRITATSKPTCPGIKGGQGHSGAELEQSADLLPALALAGAVILVLACIF